VAAASRSNPDSDDVSWLRALLESRRPDPGPVVGRWALGDVHYRGTLRSRELSPGMLAAVVLADPAVRECLEATAAAHGIAIFPADDDVMEDADERAEQIKSMLASIQSKIDKLRC
jgi:hypothetical protein